MFNNRINLKGNLTKDPTYKEVNNTTVLNFRVAVNEIKHWDFKVPMEYDNEIKNSSYQPSSVYGNGHSLYYANVIDTLRGKSEPETDGQDGLKTLELIIAAYESSVTGKVISLPLSKQYEL